MHEVDFPAETIVAIDTFVKKRLRPLQPEHGYYVSLLMRRKWLQHYYLSDAEARALVKSGEIKIGDAVITNLDHATRDIAAKLLSRLHKDFDYEITMKGRTYNVPELYEKYPAAFSLMVKFNQSNLRAATLNCVKDLLNEALTRPADLHVNLDPYWRRWVQKGKPVGKKYLLLDADDEDAAYWIFNRLADLGLAERIVYACSSPSAGSVHIVLPAEEGVVKTLKQAELGEHIEIKFGSFLTHIPGVNPEVFDYTEEWPSQV